MMEKVIFQIFFTFCAIQVFAQIDTTFYNSLRSNQALYLDEVYKDTLEVAGNSDDSDYFAFVFRKDDSLHSLTYYTDPDEEEYDFARGDIVEVKWKIDTIYIAGEDDSIAYDLWMVEANILSSQSFDINDTLSVLNYVLGKEFLDCYIIDWAVGDINEDNTDDFIVILESDFATEEITGDELSQIRKTVILETDEFPKMNISVYNDAIVDCSMCSGSGNRDPHEGVIIKNNQIIFTSNYGGSVSDNFEITFQYFVEKENWFLHKIQTWTYDHHEDKEYTRIRTQKDFGWIPFEHYEDIKDK